MCVCVFFCFCFCLSNFAFTICLEFIFCVFFLNPLYCHDKRLMGSWFTNQKLGLSLWVGVLSPGRWTTRVLLISSSIISENSHKSLHPNPRPSTTQLSAAPSAGCLTQRISKTGTQSQAAAGRLPTDTPNTALPINRKKLTPTDQNAGTSPSQHEAYTSHWTNLTHQGQRLEARTMTL